MFKSNSGQHMCHWCHALLLLLLLDVFPRVCSQVQHPKVLVVVELLPVWRRKLTSEHPELASTLRDHHRLEGGMKGETEQRRRGAEQVPGCCIFFSPLATDISCDNAAAPLWIKYDIYHRSGQPPKPDLWSESSVQSYGSKMTWNIRTRW